MPRAVAGPQPGQFTSSEKVRQGSDDWNRGWMDGTLNTRVTCHSIPQSCWLLPTPLAACSYIQHLGVRFTEAAFDVLNPPGLWQEVRQLALIKLPLASNTAREQLLAPACKCSKPSGAGPKQCTNAASNRQTRAGPKQCTKAASNRQTRAGPKQCTDAASNRQPRALMQLKCYGRPPEPHLPLKHRFRVATKKRASAQGRQTGRGHQVAPPRGAVWGWLAAASVT